MIVLTAKRKILSLLLAALLFLSAAFSAAAVSPTAVRAEIRRIYLSAVTLYEQNTGRTSFYGNCGVYVSYILNQLGIDDYLGGYKGNKWFGAYEDGEKLGEWTVKAIPGADCIKEICDNYSEARYIVVSYTHQTHYSDEEPGAGHVMFINMIKDGVAYFSESYRMYDRGSNTYADEGAPITMDAMALAEDHEKLYGNAIGALMFVKDGLNVTRDPDEIASRSETTAAGGDDELAGPDATTTPSTALAAVPTTIPTTVPTTVPTTIPTTVPTTVPATVTTTQRTPMEYDDDRTTLAYVIRDLAVKLGFSTDVERMIVMTSGAPTVDAMRAALPDYEITVRGAGGAPIGANNRIGTNMLLIVKYQDINFIFEISVKGDSGDGNVSSREARTALQISSRILSADGISEAQRIAFDINSDGRINTTDARLILRAAAHIITL